jgi:hypothetical protein
MPAVYRYTVSVPLPEPGSYNPNRPAGALLKAQALHVRDTLLQHMHDLAAILAIDPRTLKTERDVAEYARRATAILHTRSARSARQ